VTYGGIIHIEESHSVPLLDTLERIAAGLGVPPGWLAFGHEGYAPFMQRRPREPVPLDDPEPDDAFRAYRGRFLGVGGRLRELREKSGLSMRAQSRAAGVSVQTWSNIERGRAVPRVDIVERMAVALDVPAAWLAYGYDEDVTKGAASSPPVARS
jgi:transcriptional regulator with XRE-family HTH domain